MSDSSAASAANYSRQPSYFLVLADSVPFRQLTEQDVCKRHSACHESPRIFDERRCQLRCQNMSDSSAASVANYSRQPSYFLVLAVSVPFRQLTEQDVCKRHSACHESPRIFDERRCQLRCQNMSDSSAARVANYSRQPSYFLVLAVSVPIWQSTGQDVCKR
ncbi:hypothetical protein PUN28_010996 [Cardiocondyla obscurior]|uniref:Uncharacterized protein n=1 Tax=Cardiocondyla obscurior TaxID=286306 RepID=A0AAW2FIP7_9HYME